MLSNIPRKVGTVTLIAEQDSNNNTIRFSVSDTGPGIPKQELTHIFERFWQSESSQSKKLGVGLGLAITKGIVEAHGGSIWAESEFGHGARFYFTIPAAEPMKNQNAA